MPEEEKVKVYITFEVVCRPSDANTVASGMLASLNKDGWPNMLYTIRRLDEGLLSSQFRS